MFADSFQEIQPSHLSFNILNSDISLDLAGEYGSYWG